MIKKRTAAAKAVKRSANYGTAEPLPFVRLSPSLSDAVQINGAIDFSKMQHVDCFDEILIEQNQAALFEGLRSEWQRVLESE